MAESKFIPGPDSSRGITAVDSFDAGVNQNQSMMQRASQIRQSQQMEQMRQQQIAAETVLAPLRAAEAKAKIIGAGSAITNHTEQENLKAQAAAASVGANTEFNDAIKLADWDSQSAELSRLQAKYSWMNNVRDDKGQSLYSGFLKTIDEARANAIIRSKTDQTLEAAQTRAETAASARMDASGNSLEARKYVADASAQSRETVAAINAAAKETTAAGSQGASMDRTMVHGLNVAAIEADKEALKFDQAGEEAKAAEARRTAESFRAQAKEKATKPMPTEFNVPNVTKSAGQKLYTPPVDGGAPSFTPAVKTPDDVLSAMQQMVNDGVITADQARETLGKLGFKKKGG